MRKMVKITLFLTIIPILLFGQTSPHGNLKNLDCGDCHQSTNWKVIPAQIKFDHSQTGFSLDGKHQIVDCKNCHSSLVFSKVSSECRSCHVELHQSTLGFDCAKCHDSNSWQIVDMVTKHNQLRFALAGVHQIRNCNSCHRNAINFIYSIFSLECFSCHKSEYETAKNPIHTSQSFSKNCDDCHTVNSRGWTAEKFIHVPISLTGAHTKLECNQCHTNNQPITENCYDCHQSNYNNASNPNHTNAGISTACEDCHNSTSWKPSTFNHSSTGFPLTGKHTLIEQCSSCHKGTTTGTSQECFSCHQDKYNSAPEHISKGYPTNCKVCHTTNDWKEANFNHGLTTFPLTGAHIYVKCAQCHTAGYTGTPTQCYACHQIHYQNTTNPNHQALALSTDCETCHSTDEGWKPAKFPQHNDYFPLTGRHLEIANDCAQCHNGNYTTTSNECFGCHQNNYNQATNPNHTAAGISTNCESCHNTTSWIPSTFDHSSTGFALTGSHLNIQCSSCHNGTTSSASPLCNSCHQDDYNTAPNHLSQRYPTNCEMCHNTMLWTQTSFDHSSTAFPLTGAHITLSCSQCHSNGFSGTPTQCFACHQTHYQNTTNPNHQALSLSTNCETCHSTNPDWKPALYPKHNTNPPGNPILTGYHSTLISSNNCMGCHKGNYNTTPSNCYGCHQANWNGTTNPNHTAAGFPTTCQTCHNQNIWQGATFNHTWFPIYSGKHKNKWSTCTAECHTNPTNFSVFSCITCHEHRQSKMDDEHKNVAGYVYLSSACYSCHPTGEDSRIRRDLRID